MKRYLTMLLIISLCIFVFTGCSKKIEDLSSINKIEITKFSTTSDNDNIYNEASSLTCYTAQQPSWANPDLQISQEQAEFIIGIWNNSVWENDITETEYDYVFRCENIEVRYCYGEGIFNDAINNKHVILSEDIREQVNKVVDKFIVLPIID